MEGEKKMKYYNITIDQAKKFINEGKILWACAYVVNNETLHVSRHEKPVKGILKDYRKPSFHKFTRNGDYYSTGVYYSSRQYADTYEECVEIFNELVMNRANKLQMLADACKEELIPVGQNKGIKNDD